MLTRRKLSPQEENQIEDAINGVTANRLSITHYLHQTFEMTREEADALVTKHVELIQHGNELGSYCYYIIDQIIQAEGGES